MRSLSSSLVLLIACSSPPPPPAPVPLPADPAPQTSASAVASAPAPQPAQPKSQKPTIPDFEVLARTGMPPEFAEVEKNFKDKYFEQALQALETQQLASKRGQLAHDHKMLMYACVGFASAMQNRGDEAKGAYRRILPMWANWRKEAKAIQALEKDAAAGEKRVQGAVDAAGEAMFYLAEQQRIKADEMAMPSNDGDGSPASVEKFVGGKAKQWVARRTQAIKKAATEYDRVLKLEPKPPPRLVAAAASRIGAMHGLVLEELRTITGLEGDAAKKLSALSDPVKQAAADAYHACVQVASASGVADSDVFLKSCKDWLDANP